MKFKQSVFPAVVASFLILCIISPINIANAQQESDEQEWVIVLIAAMAATATLVAAAISLAVVGTAAIGAIAEKPEISSMTFVYVVFIEAIGIYGLVLAFLILRG